MYAHARFFAELIRHRLCSGPVALQLKSRGVMYGGWSSIAAALRDAVAQPKGEGRNQIKIFLQTVKLPQKQRIQPWLKHNSQRSMRSDCL